MVVPEPLPSEGFAVRLRAAFLGFRRFPLLAVAHNNASPKLVLHDAHVEYRVLGTRQLPYADIDGVDVYRAWKTENIRLARRSALLVFSANVADAAVLAALVSFFMRRGVTISARARSFVATRQNEEAPHAEA